MEQKPAPSARVSATMSKMPSNPNLNNAPLNDFIAKVGAQLITPTITLLALIAFLVFVWGVVEYVRNAGEEEARKKGQLHILWGVVGLAIIFGANAIVHLLSGVAASL
jgi:predicted permease